MRIESNRALMNDGGTAPTHKAKQADAVTRLLSRELVQRLLPEMPGTGQAGLASEFWVDAVADRLSARDWLSLRQVFDGAGVAGGAKLFGAAVDSHDQQTDEGRMP